MQRRSRALKGASLTNRASSSSMPEPRADRPRSDADLPRLNSDLR
ncbi:Uncharacterized protein APZ42_010248, partial [Daphnia magna]